MYQVPLLADTCNLVPDNMADVDTPVVLDNTGEKRAQFYCSLAFLRNTIYIDNSNPTCLCVVTVILKMIFAKMFFYSLKSELQIDSKKIVSHFHNFTLFVYSSKVFSIIIQSTFHELSIISMKFSSKRKDQQKLAKYPSFLTK